MIWIKRADEMGERIRDMISDVFADGFGHWFQSLSKDKEKLSAAFSHMFNLGLFYVALIEDQVVGIAACTDGKELSVRLDKSECKKYLVFFERHYYLRNTKKEFEGRKYPFQLTPEMGSIEFVAASSKHRGKGIAPAVKRHIFRATDFKQYVLEAADTNSIAIKVYEKLGFL